MTGCLNFNFVSLVLCSRILLTFSNNIEEVKGKNVIITGAAQGIGYATANSFLKSGAKKVIIIDIDRQKGIEAYSALSFKYGQGRIEFINCDVTTCLETTITYLIKKYEIIDLLINNAGIANERMVRRTIDVNAIAVMKGTLKMLEHMRIDEKGKGGAIINISSIYGFRIDQFFAVYKASKFAVLGFSKSLGFEDNFAKHGVRVLTVCPGFTNTSMIQNVVTSSPEVAQYLKNQPLQPPETVGEAIAEVYMKATSGSVWLIENKKLTII